jgi:crossover junction endodeoxyribonuclease RusA
MIIDVAGDPMTQGSHIAILPRGASKPILVESGDNARRARFRAWRKTITAAAAGEMHGRAPTDQPVKVRLEFRLPRPRTVTREYPTAKMDVDKLARAVLDSLTRTVFVDDGQVVNLMAEKRYTRDDEQPGVRIVVRHAT